MKDNCWRPWDHSSPDCEQVREQARVDAAFELLLAPMKTAPGEPPAGQERPLAEREERA